MKAAPFEADKATTDLQEQHIAQERSKAGNSGVKNSCPGLTERIKRPHTHREKPNRADVVCRKRKRTRQAAGELILQAASPQNTTPCSSPCPAGHHLLLCPIVPIPAA